MPGPLPFDFVPVGFVFTLGVVGVLMVGVSTVGVLIVGVSTVGVGVLIVGESSPLVRV